MNVGTTTYRALLALCLVVAAGAVLALPGSAGATAPAMPLFRQCPHVGLDAGCGVLISVGANGVATVLTDPGQPRYDAQDDTLVGIVNDTSLRLTSIRLAGVNARKPFGFDSDGLCFVKPSPCTAATKYGPTGSEGPGTSFAEYGSLKVGSVLFTGGLGPGASRYFTLDTSPFTVVSLAVVHDITVTGNSISATEGTSADFAAGSFTAGTSTAPTADYSATINWGDGTSSTGSIAQSAPGAPYEVTGIHSYAEEGGHTTTISVVDDICTKNTGTGSGGATVSDAPLSATSSVVADQAAGAGFSATVATFTDTNPTAPLGDFSASVDWGDGSSSSPGAVAVSSPGYTVTASHTYTGNGTFPVTVTIHDVGGATTSATDTVNVPSTQFTCSGSPCSGTVTSPTQSDTVNNPSGTGTVTATLSPDDGSLSCPNDPFRHAPEYTTVTDTGVGANLSVTVSFNNIDAPGNWDEPFAVCYQASPGAPFTDYYGNTGQTVGLLPFCSTDSNSAPCVQSIVEAPNPLGNPSKAGTVTEQVLIPPGDPKWR